MCSLQLLVITGIAVAQQTASDDFERHLLGNNWSVYFGSGDVQIVDSSDLGFPVSGYFGLLGWTATSFAANQYSEIIISPDKIDSMLCQAFVRRRSSDFARYGFHWNNAYGGRWEIKYDGVPTAQTRILDSLPGAPPANGDTVRIEISGMTISGYLNGNLMLQATDTAFTTSNPITTTGVPGIAYRFTTTFTPVFPSPVIEQWNGGDLAQTSIATVIEKTNYFEVFPNPCHLNSITVKGINDFNNIACVEILNLSGQTIISQSITTEKNFVTLDISNLSAGIYFLKIITHKEIFVSKVIKENNSY